MKNNDLQNYKDCTKDQILFSALVSTDGYFDGLKQICTFNTVLVTHFCLADQLSMLYSVQDNTMGFPSVSQTMDT